MMTNSQMVERKRKSAASKVQLPPFSEAEVWKPVTSIWQQLYGSFNDLGISIEWHDFTSTTEFDWSRSFHPGSLELCLNLSGQAEIQSADGIASIQPLTQCLYLPGSKPLKATRKAGERHQFVTIEFSADFLRNLVGESDGALHPLVEHAIQATPSQSAVAQVQNLTSAQQHWVTQLMNPPVPQPARKLWYRSKVLEIMAELFFARPGEDELFCDRQQRVARQRVDRVIAILRAHLAEPPSLEDLGKQVGCSPFYLSRIFSKEMRMTIPQFLRQIRMEKAAELLGSGKCNVTEAALEVGYSSLSHFSQAFCQTIGCCPNLYPLQKSGARAD